jgi:cobalt-zinc-cadmium efflux system outer membrane protein
MSLLRLPLTFGLALLLAGCFSMRSQFDSEIGDLNRRLDDGAPSRVIDRLPSAPRPPAPATQLSMHADLQQAGFEQEDRPAITPGTYKLTDRSLTSLREAKVPEAVLEKLRTLKDREFATREEFVKALAEKLNRDELESYQSLVLNRAITRIEPPADLPGAGAPMLQPPKDPRERQRYYQSVLGPIPTLAPERPPAQGPEGHPLSLSDLQRLAETYSPAIKSAYEAADAARGAAFQAGQYPNPTFAYEHDTTQTGPGGYPGFFVDQLIKTGGKLTVAQAAATMDFLNARLALRRARSDVRYAVRGNYFAVLVALENIRINEALFRFFDDIYRFQLESAEKGFDPGYLAMQLRPLALQARLNIIQARNQYHASWRQLAASLGLPDMPPTMLEGQVDLPVPVFEYEEVLARLRNHTDLLTAEVSLQKAVYNLKLAKLQPLPDVDVHVVVQKDYTAPPGQVAPSVQVVVPIPIWDQNRGGIYQAERLLAQATVGPDNARNALINTLADAYNRYRTARETVAISLRQIRDQVRVYRYLRERREEAGSPVGFGDLVTAQQTLAGFISSYVTALGLQWQAVVDVANLLQTDDLFYASREQEGMEPVPDMRYLLPPPEGLFKHHRSVAHPAGSDCQTPPSSEPAAPPAETPAMPPADARKRAPAAISPASFADPGSEKSRKPAQAQEGGS